MKKIDVVHTLVCSEQDWFEAFIGSRPDINQTPRVDFSTTTINYKHPIKLECLPQILPSSQKMEMLVRLVSTSILLGLWSLGALRFSSLCPTASKSHWLFCMLLLPMFLICLFLLLPSLNMPPPNISLLPCLRKWLLGGIFQNPLLPLSSTHIMTLLTAHPLLIPPCSTLSWRGQRLPRRSPLSLGSERALEPGHPPLLHPRGLLLALEMPLNRL